MADFSAPRRISSRVDPIDEHPSQQPHSDAMQSWSLRGSDDGDAGSWTMRGLVDADLPTIDPSASLLQGQMPNSERPDGSPLALSGKSSDEAIYDLARRTGLTPEFTRENFQLVQDAVWKGEPWTVKSTMATAPNDIAHDWTAQQREGFTASGDDRLRRVIDHILDEREDFSTGTPERLAETLMNADGSFSRDEQNISYNALKTFTRDLRLAAQSGTLTNETAASFRHSMGPFASLINPDEVNRVISELLEDKDDGAGLDQIEKSAYDQIHRSKMRRDPKGLAAGALRHVGDIVAGAGYVKLMNPTREAADTLIEQLPSVATMSRDDYAEFVRSARLVDFLPDHLIRTAAMIRNNRSLGREELDEIVQGFRSALKKNPPTEPTRDEIANALAASYIKLGDSIAGSLGPNLPGMRRARQANEAIGEFVTAQTLGAVPRVGTFMNAAAEAGAAGREARGRMGDKDSQARWAKLGFFSELLLGVSAKRLDDKVKSLRTGKEVPFLEEAAGAAGALFDRNVKYGEVDLITDRMDMGANVSGLGTWSGSPFNRPAAP